MGIYAKYVLPHIIDFAMRSEETTRLRAKWIPRACGEVLEIGIGSGLNLPFYSTEVRRVYGVDPSLQLQQMALVRAMEAPMEVNFVAQSAEEPLPVDDASIDTVVVTWALCSIPNTSRVLRQLRRVLKDRGRLIFLEHGLAPDAATAAWQDRLTPAWRHITGGCHLNRKMDDLIRIAGFHITELKTGYLRGPRPMTYTYQGIAAPIWGQAGM